MKAKPKGGLDTTQVFPLQTAARRRSPDSVREVMEALGLGHRYSGWAARVLGGYLRGGHPLLPPPQGLPRGTASPSQPWQMYVTQEGRADVHGTLVTLLLLRPRRLSDCPSLSSLTAGTPMSPVSLRVGSPWRILLCIYLKPY